MPPIEGSTFSIGSLAGSYSGSRGLAPARRGRGGKKCADQGRRSPVGASSEALAAQEREDGRRLAVGLGEGGDARLVQDGEPGQVGRLFGDVRVADAAFGGAVVDDLAL